MIINKRVLGTFHPTPHPQLTYGLLLPFHKSSGATGITALLEDHPTCKAHLDMLLPPLFAYIGGRMPPFSPKCKYKISLTADQGLLWNIQHHGKST